MTKDTRTGSIWNMNSVSWLVKTNTRLLNILLREWVTEWQWALLSCEGVSGHTFLTPILVFVLISVVTDYGFKIMATCKGCSQYTMSLWYLCWFYCRQCSTPELPPCHRWPLPYLIPEATVKPSAAAATVGNFEGDGKIGLHACSGGQREEPQQMADPLTESSPGRTLPFTTKPPSW